VLSRRLRAIGSTVLAGVVLAPAAALAGGIVGSDGAGDPFFPQAGNGGYQVRHYDLGVRYHRSGHLDGLAKIDAVAASTLSRFDLDLRERMGVASVRVNGASASFAQDGQELRITPASELPAAGSFTARIRYEGKPRFVEDPDGSMDGWVPTDDGAVVVSEPQGSPTWFPCNDHPSDKATYDVDVTVPASLKAISNGTLRSRARHGKRVTFSWHEPDPMATYLATATIGQFHLTRSRAVGVPTYVAVDRGTKDGAVEKLPSVLEFFSHRFGRYPFTAAGAIIDPSGVGYSLEVQTKPYFPGGPGEILLAHELAHQWFGDSVSLERWRDIWLNEGFATWAQWLWNQHTGGQTTAQTFDDLYSTPASNASFWNPPPGDPGSPDNLFDGTVYDRGGMTLELLRQQVGNHTFFRILRAWTHDHEHANGNTQGFIDLAEAKSGMDLSGFFQDWLFTPGKPAQP
jgi:aminopeptidase N